MERTPIATLAKKTADVRRTLMGVYDSDLGVRIAIDLMGIMNPSPEHFAFAKIIADTHRDTLARSELFLADPEMVDLLDAAAPSMPDQELLPTDIMVPDGFIYFAEPLPDRSGVAPEIPIHALSWAWIPEGHPLLTERGVGDSVLITAYIPMKDLLVARNMLKPGDQIAPGTPKYMADATVMWTVGTLIGEAFGDVPPPGGYTPGFYQRLLASFWTLAQQPKVTTTDHETPGKPTDHRRYRRAGITDPTAPVHVIRLHRRPQSGVTEAIPGEPTGRKMTVRSATRGHWRRQWYPSVQQHRHIFIDPYWRGPEDAPIVGGERVFLAHGPKTDPGQTSR